MKKAIILLSGGLDSATVLYHAKAKKYKPYCLIFEYGQRHNTEVSCAKKIARRAQVESKLVTINLPWQGSSLLDKSMKIPQHRTTELNKIPSTYVPARNIIFLSFAASYAEAIGAEAVFIGANAIDYSGYPDCRPEFFKAYSTVLKKGLKTGVEGKKIRILTPLLDKTKAQIIRMGTKLEVPFQFTWSCYKGSHRPCGWCESCIIREKGFEEVGIIDPLLNRLRYRR